MKVVLVNGSPNKEGCTYTALKEVASTLEEQGVETEIFWIGKKAISGCNACRKCRELKKCIFDDPVNEFLDKAETADAFVFGSPVYWAGANGAMKAFLDRVYYANAYSGRNLLAFKPAASVTSARRAGTSVTLDELNHFITHDQMLLVGSTYWPMVHGYSPEDVMQDEEGLQIMRQLGRNIAWTLALKRAGEEAGVPLPEQEKPIQTNFIKRQKK